jgi:hypothetical protein
MMLLSVPARLTKPRNPGTSSAASTARDAHGGMSVRFVASDASCRAMLRAKDPFRVSDVSAVIVRKERQLMPRLYGPGHFTEDPYSQVVSPHGIPVDDLVSVLQKEIRRSHVDNAVLAA